MSVPYIPARLMGGHQSTIRRIVIHGTSSPCKAGGARANAKWLQDPRARGSAHYVVDPGEIVQCVPEDRVAAHAPPNTGSIGYELCDPNAGDPARWHDALHDAMMRRAATHVRDCAARHGVPLVWLSPAEVKAGTRGITSHNNVTAAFHQSTHTDPVGFDVGHWMAILTGPSPAQPYGLDVLRPGDDDRTRGDHRVAGVQMMLDALANRWGDATLHPGPVDGVYGARTEAAVRAFKRRIIALQRATHQAPWPNDDAIVGPATYGALEFWVRVP